MTFETITVGSERPSEVADLPDAKKRKSSSRGRLIVRRFFHTKRGWVGLSILVLLALWAIFGSMLDHWTYQSQDYLAILKAPSASHPFGSDQVGSDIYQQTVRGLQKSLVIGLIAGPVGTCIAAVVGSVAGYFPGKVDSVLRWIIELMLVVPSFFLLVLLSPRIKTGGTVVLIALIAGFSWMIMALVVRGQTRSLREREFVRAARYMGVSSIRIIFRHIIPNVASLLIIDATLGVGAAIMTESTLSFFGFGVQSPDVSLGTLLAAGQNSATSYPWLFVFPAAALVITVLAASMVGDALRDAVDPTSGVNNV